MPIACLLATELAASAKAPEMRGRRTITWIARDDYSVTTQKRLEAAWAVGEQLRRERGVRGALPLSLDDREDALEAAEERREGRGYVVRALVAVRVSPVCHENTQQDGLVKNALSFLSYEMYMNKCLPRTNCLVLILHFKKTGSSFAPGLQNLKTDLLSIVSFSRTITCIFLLPE